MREYMNILKEMLKEREKITIRNMIGSQGYGGEREKKKEKKYDK